MQALQAARVEMGTFTAELRIRTAMLSKVPLNSDLILKPGDQVRVFREIDKKYTGPYTVIRVDGDQLYVLV